MNKGFSALERATKKAFDKLSATSEGNKNPDADVKFYETLTPEAFDVIASVYGPDNLVKYVEEMETKRMKGVKNAGQ